VQTTSGCLCDSTGTHGLPYLVGLSAWKLTYTVQELPGFDNDDDNNDDNNDDIDDDIDINHTGSSSRPAYSLFDDLMEPHVSWHSKQGY
jgi:hypothetical protein